MQNTLQFLLFCRVLCLFLVLHTHGTCNALLPEKSSGRDDASHMCLQRLALLIHNCRQNQNTCNLEQHIKVIRHNRRPSLSQKPPHKPWVELAQTLASTASSLHSPDDYRRAQVRKARFEPRVERGQRDAAFVCTQGASGCILQTSSSRSSFKS